MYTLHYIRAWRSDGRNDGRANAVEEGRRSDVRRAEQARRLPPVVVKKILDTKLLNEIYLNHRSSTTRPTKT